MSIRAGIKAYSDLFGWKGLWTISSFRLFGVPKEITVQPPVARYPIHLRTRTSDVSVYKDVLLGGEYELGLGDFVPNVILDIGANVGMAAIYYANRYPSAKIIAVEPEASNYGVLQKNVASYPNIITVNAALWNKDGQISLGPIAMESEKWAFTVRDGSGTPVRAMTMSTLMSETGVDSVDLLKMDVEGAEIEVFEIHDWIATVKVIVVELHDRMRPGCSSAVTTAARGFSRWNRGEMTFFARPELLSAACPKKEPSIGISV